MDLWWFCHLRKLESTFDFDDEFEVDEHLANNNHKITRLTLKISVVVSQGILNEMLIINLRKGNLNNLKNYLNHYNCDQVFADTSSYVTKNFVTNYLIQQMNPYLLKIKE